MMGIPQPLSNQPAAGTTLSGVVPPKGASQTQVDLGPGYAPKYIVLARPAFERVVLMRMVVNNSEIPVLPQRDGEIELYPLPLWTPDQVQTTRRVQITWSNRSNRGAQFTYQICADRPVPPAPPAPTPMPQTIMGPPIGMTTPMQLPNQQQFSNQQFLNQVGPMSPPAFPLAAQPVPTVQAVPQAAPTPGYAPAPPPVYAMPPQAAVPTVGNAQVMPAMMAPPAPPAGTAAQPAAPPVQQNAFGMPMYTPASEPPPTELESHVAGCLGVTYMTIRQQAQSYAAQHRFAPEAILATYVNNFGSSGLELVPREWIESANQMANQTGLPKGEIIASTVLRSLVQRMAEDRDFSELQKSGAVAALIGGGQSGRDFVVRSEASAPAAEEKVPETARTGRVPRVTGGQLRDLAIALKVEPTWLLPVINTLAKSRGQNPDELVQLATPQAMRLLRKEFLEEATADVDAKLEQAKTMTDEMPADDADSAFSETPTEEQLAAARDALIEQAVVTRSLDWIVRDLVAEQQKAEPQQEPKPEASAELGNT